MLLAPPLAALLACVTTSAAIIRPLESNRVLTNPGIGFTTFQRFNGDELNPGLTWTEGFPINAKPARDGHAYRDHPETSIAYFRVYWRYLQPKEDEFRWELIDQALDSAKRHGQTLMLRVPPYGPREEGAKSDVPDWYRARAKERANVKLKNELWLVDPESSAYLEQYGGFIKKLAARYDGNPNLELVDVSIVGPWGEGAGSDVLSKSTRDDLLRTYVENFKKTPLVVQPNDWANSAPATSRKFQVGFRADCLGDMNLLSKTWSHMLDLYPQYIITSGLSHTWESRPIAFEACDVLGSWKKHGVNLDYVIEQSLKWHISTFNGKSSAVPREWRGKIDRWLKKMGYRFVLRRFQYPDSIKRGERLEFTSWWENKGVAPSYRNYPVALRLVQGSRRFVLPTDSDIRQWMPGDNLLNAAIPLPTDIAPGQYELQIALVDEATAIPRVKLAIQNPVHDGWYALGRVTIRER